MIMAAQELVENIRFLNQNFTFSSLCLTFSLEFTLMQFFLYFLKDINVNLWGVFSVMLHLPEYCTFISTDHHLRI